MNDDLKHTKRALVESMEFLHQGRTEQAQAKMLEALTCLTEGGGGAHRNRIPEYAES